MYIYIKIYNAITSKRTNLNEFSAMASSPSDSDSESGLDFDSDLVSYFFLPYLSPKYPP